MENASKALLIAGAVLIVILLIGIGMLIYSKSTGVVDTAASTMSTQEIQSFNSQFTPYEGKQKGSSVKNLVDTVIANNATYNTSDNYDAKEVRIHLKEYNSMYIFSINRLSEIRSTLDSNAEYNVQLIYERVGNDGSTTGMDQLGCNGLVGAIKITKI